MLSNSPKLKLILMTIVTGIILSVVTYASTNQTLQFFGNIGEGTVRDSNWLLALANDSCKVFLPLCTGFAFHKKKYFLAGLLSLTILCTITVSYFASQGLDLNVTNEDVKQAMVSDTKFITNQNTISQSQEELKELKDKLEILENKDIESTFVKDFSKLFDKDPLILSLQDEYKLAKSKHLITTRPPHGRGTQLISEEIKIRKQEIINYTKEIESEKLKAHNESIKRIQSQIDLNQSNKENSLNIINNFTSSEIRTTKGYTALAKFLNTEAGDITKFKNLLMEFMGIVLSLLLGFLLGDAKAENVVNSINFRKNISNIANRIKKATKGHRTVTASTKINKGSDLEVGTATVIQNKLSNLFKKKELTTRKIGFKQGTHIDDKTKEDIKHMLKIMFKNVDNKGILLGVNKLVKKASEDGHTSAKTTWETLRALGIIEVKDGSTYLYKEEAKKWM